MEVHHFYNILNGARNKVDSGKIIPLPPLSSLHCSTSLSFCSFSYNGVCFDNLKLSVNDVIVNQKGSNQDEKLQFFGRDYNFTCTLCTKIQVTRSATKFC